MAWTEQDYQEIVARIKAESQGVGDVPNAETLTGISSLPAYQEKDGEDIIVRAPLELLAAPALDAADKANEAADKAESNATAAQTAADTANEKAELAAQAASDANAAKEGAETATQSANNAASNAEEKAEAANTAAQDAEKVANNPTYIGTDHYVYVYNKETDSFDKTGIYCKGEPGSSFRVAGEYATLEALKSAVPDGSAVDGFMAVGTEAPYDYYAWVNGDWANQGKIAGGGSGNVVVIPAEAMRLTSQSTSDEILNAFGGKDAFLEIAKKAYNEDVVVVVPVISSGKVSYISSLVMASYTDNDNASIGVTFNAANSAFSVIITLSSGNATYAKNEITLLTEAPSNGNAYGRKNGDWVKVPEKSDVLTKGNETEYTPTKPYQPATKKYVDDKTFVRDVDGTTLNKWINNTVITGETVQDLADELFGNFRSFAENYFDGNYTGLKFSTRQYDDAAGAWFGYIINANIQYCLSEPGNGYFELLFTFGYGSTLKSCDIHYYSASETSNENKIVITDVVRSDNLTTVTKKTAAEYEALGSKDANTVYCVTD